MVAALHAVAQVKFHVVAQVVEAELVVGPVGHVAGIGFAALTVVQVVDDDSDRQPQHFVELPHPLGVAAGQVVVHRDNVDALALQRVEVGGQGGDQGLAFAGLHFGDFTLMQDPAADQLHIKVAHVEGAAARFAHHGKDFHEKVIQGLALLEPLAEFVGFSTQFGVAQPLDGRLEISNRANHRPHPLQFTLILGADDFCQQGTNHNESSPL